MMGMAIHTNDKAMIERAWNNGMNKLGNMLESLKAEIKEILENEPDILSVYKEKEENKLKRRARVMFFLLCYSLPICVAVFFAQKIINTENFDWKDVMTWINPNVSIRPIPSFSKKHSALPL
jgi:hypothetical protein